MELLDNLGLNPRPDVLTQVNDCCLSDAAGEVTLHIPRTEGSAFASMKKQNYSGVVDRIVTRAITLDEYCKTHGIQSIDLLKIDVEGAELMVLMGASMVLSGDSKPVILIESYPPMTKAFDYSVSDVIAYIISLGYKGYVFHADALVALSGDNYKLGYDYLFLDINRTLESILN
jgi:FkbM family methyltransferase